MTESSGDGLIRIRPVLFCAPVFWSPQFWVEDVHRWDWVDPQTPLDEKPWVELEVSLDVTLGDVVDAACDAWGIERGPDAQNLSHDRRDEFIRWAFVSEGTDAAGVDPQVGYQWPWSLPIATEDGKIEERLPKEISYRELLAASELGLIEGDVMRPYLHPVRPQGNPGALIEAGKLTLAAIRAAYAGIDDSIGYAEHTIRLIAASMPRVVDAVDKNVNPVIDEGIRIGAVVTFAAWLRRKARRRPHDDEPK